MLAFDRNITWIYYVLEEPVKKKLFPCRDFKIYRFERFKRILQSVLSKTLCVKCVKEQPYTFWMVGGSRRTQWSADC